MAKNFLSEDDIEQALLQKLQHLHGFDVLDYFTAKADDLNDGTERKDKRDVVLADRLQRACERLNQDMPVESIEQVVDEDLPDSYDRVLFMEKSDHVFNLIVDFAVQGKKWAA